MLARKDHKYMPIFLMLILSWLPFFGCDADSGRRTPEAPATTVSQAPPADSASARLFREVMEDARRDNLHERPLGEVMQEIGLKFLGKPYAAGLLDKSAEETLVCRLDGFDCVTFFETALAMARGIRAQDYSWQRFTENLANTRYRNGEMDGYCSRLHYFSDWIFDNQERGNVVDLTRELGGTKFTAPINYMTTHRESYPNLKNSDENTECMQAVEDHIADLDIFFIPENRIRQAYPRLKAGDIIGTATRLRGLDVTHTGLVYDDGRGGIGFLHASPQGGVKISPDLEKYILGNKDQIGILVVRPVADESK